MVDLDYLKTYSEVQSTKISWIWYPYIAANKITLLQGDPGDGKSTLMLNLIAELSKGGTLPNKVSIDKPVRCMYQCSEDGAADTIKPRLDSFKANCDNVVFIDEEIAENLTLDDERIKESLIKFKPKLVVIDPIQSYIGADSNIMVTGRARKLMHRLSIWASMYDCAIVLIGHFTKNEGTKDLYRGIGSIDVVAAARSVLQVEVDESDPNIKRLKQVKNSLAPKGADVYYELGTDKGFHWIDSPQVDTTDETVKEDRDITKTEAATLIIYKKLQNGMVPSSVMVEALHTIDVGDRTIRNAKKELGIRSVRKDGQWYWALPDEDNSGDENDEGRNKKKNT